MTSISSCFLIPMAGGKDINGDVLKEFLALKQYS